MTNTIETHGIKNYYIKASHRKNTPPFQLISTKGVGSQNKFRQSLVTSNSSIALKSSPVKLLQGTSSSALIIRPDKGSSEIMKLGMTTVINRPIISRSQIGENLVVQSGRSSSDIPKNSIAMPEISIESFTPVNEEVVINPIFKIKADLERSNIDQKNSKSMIRAQSNESLFWKNNTYKIEKS